jgi:pimeloyl-ACP methyl ester carboxylesterase
MTTNHHDAALICDVPYTQARIPLWRELSAGAEWLALRFSLTYWGVGVPRGHGEPVIVVPGFLGSDFYLWPLRFWLRRIGYRSYMSDVGRNDKCPDEVLPLLLKRVAEVHEETGQRVRLIGHSLGGSISRAAAGDDSKPIAQVITLGSPINGVDVHPVIAGLARLYGVIREPDSRPHLHENGHTHGHSCSKEVMETVARPLPTGVALTSIYSRTDGVVHWPSSRDSVAERNVEVRGSHLGLVVNLDVYREIARLLASPPPTGSPAQPARRAAARQL